MLTRVIAVCGIDGSGKSSALASLATLAEFKEVRFTSFQERDNVTLLRRRSPSDRAADFDGHTLCRAYAADFCAYERRLAGETSQAPVVSDRWAPCVLAFCSHQERLSALRDELASIYPPALILYFDVLPETAFERIRDRDEGGSNKSLDALRSYACGYERELAIARCPVVRIRQGRRDETVNQARVALVKHLESVPAS
jgi:thymidylate kinase